MKRVGFLTSGGDCQALNATMRGVAKGLYQIYKDEVEIIGFEDGYKGLMYANYLMMKQSDFSGVLTKGGTMLGTSRQPFKLMRVPDENGLDKVELMKHTYYKLKLDALVVLGGNGSQKTANLLSQEGLHRAGEIMVQEGAARHQHPRDELRAVQNQHARALAAAAPADLMP